MGVQPRQGVFQVMAHPRLLSRGETKAPFCSLGSFPHFSNNRTTLLVYVCISEARLSAVSLRQLVEMHKVVWIRKNREQVCLPKKQQDKEAKLYRLIYLHSYSIMVLLVCLCINTVMKVKVHCYWCSSTRGLFFKANRLKVVFV